MKAKNLILYFLSFSILLFCIEVFSFFALKFFKSKNFISKETQDFYSIIYNTEDKKEIQNRYTLNTEQYRRYIFSAFQDYDERPFDGQFVNVTKQNFRHENFNEKLSKGAGTAYFFGGSTTFGYGVYDTETIPARVEEYSNNLIKTYNFGAGGYYSTSERIKFLKLLTAGYIPEYAIFIDGLNDFHYYEVPDKSEISLWLGGWLEDSDPFTYRTLLKLTIKKLRTYKLFLEVKNKINNKFKNIPAHYKNQETNIGNIEKSLNRLNTNRRLLNSICINFDIKCLFVNQPVSTFNFDQNRSLKIGIDMNNIGKHINSKKGYELIQNKKKSGDIFDENVLWLEFLTTDEIMYIDRVHYSPEFSKKIAQEIYKKLK